MAHLNLGVAGEGSLLLALHEEKRPILGEIQGPALNSEIWPRAPITRFPILVVKKEQGKKKKQAWRTLVLLRRPGELLEGGEDFEVLGHSVKYPSVNITIV